MDGKSIQRLPVKEHTARNATVHDLTGEELSPQATQAAPAAKVKGKLGKKSRKRRLTFV